MNSESFSASGLRIKQVHIRSDSQSGGQNFYCKYLASAVTMPHRRILAHYKQMSEFERGLSIGLLDILVKAMLSRMGKNGRWVRTTAVDLGS